MSESLLSGDGHPARSHDPRAFVPDPVNGEEGDGVAGRATRDVDRQHRADALAALARATAPHARGLETPTAIPRLTIWRSLRPTPTAPAMFGPKAYLLLQGSKQLTIAHRSFTSHPGDCSVSAVGLPFSGRVTVAAPDAPYLGLALELDPTLARDVLLAAPAGAVRRDAPGPGLDDALHVATASAALIAAFARLVALLAQPADLPVMLPLVERELYYRLLQSELGPALGAFVQPRAHLAQVQRAATWLAEHAAEPMAVARLAAMVGMSASSFHRHFKAVTALSPLAYQRRLRLLDAQRRLAQGEGNVTAVAFAVGYASASQFSREYARLLGVPPSATRRHG